MEMLLNLLLFAGLGVVAGTLSGLFGIGGGMVIVPGLFYLFQLMDIPRDALMHMAAGTSMGIMVFTAAASTWSHHLRGDVQWPLFRRIIGGITCGVILGNLLAERLHTNWLELIFGVFLLAASIKILTDWKPTAQEPEMPRSWVSGLVGSAIGFKSGVLGIGGGALSVPFLLSTGLSVKQASGTSASFTLPIALVGTTSFLLLTGHETGVPWATGYILWPAVALVAPFTMLGAPLGTKLSHALPAQRLKSMFAAFLLLLSLRLLATSFDNLFFWGAV